MVGAGFGGLAVARGLDGHPVDVTVVDRNNFHTFLPLLYQVATSGLNAADVAHPIRGILQRSDNVNAHLGSVVGVDWERRLVRLRDQPPMPFDHLVVAAGSGTSYFGVPGAAEHSLPLYSLADATALRNRVLAAFEEADADPAATPDGALTFVIVGGGPTGVETAGALAELFEHVLRHDFPGVAIDRARVVLVEMAGQLLSPFKTRSQTHALKALQERGVEVRFDTRVERVEADHVVLGGGEILPTHTLVWAAGVRANPLADVLGLPVGAGGRISVADDCSVPGFPGVWAIGDIADFPADDEDGVPQLAPAAMQSGDVVASNIVATMRGEPTRPFRYRNKGTMATIGRRAAVTELPRFPVLTGTVAWVAWLVLHIWMLMGMRNRLSVFVNWMWNYFTWDRGPRIIFPSKD